MADENTRISPDSSKTAPQPRREAPELSPLRDGKPSAGLAEESARDKRAQAKPAHHEPKDVFREVAETIVFVVVLVLLLKTFTAEAFVIPTGSMAETLWGYQKEVTCPQCGHEFPVNCSSEVDPQDKQQKAAVVGCICPNCYYLINFTYEVEGKIFAFDDTRLGVHGDDGTDYEFALDPEVQITLDGQETGRHELRRERPVRVLFNRVDGRTAVSIEVATRGSFPRKDKPFEPKWSSGDRVLVAKFIYDLRPPERYEVIVFKYPERPQSNHVQTNYIKRLIGKPGETIAIYYGKLYVAEGLTYKGRPGPVKEEDQRLKEFMYEDDPEVRDLFKQEVDGALDQKRVFQLFRKSPEQLLAVRRLVYDNDHQAKDLGTSYIRWNGEENNGWKPDDPSHPKKFHHPGGPAMEWLRYSHILRGPKRQRELITDFMGYNFGRTDPGQAPSRNPELHWVGDLMLECEASVEKADKDDELRFELSKGIDRFQARFQPATGKCTLVRRSEAGLEKELDSKQTRLKGPGKYRIRFANVDERLTVWVDNDLPFGDGVPYDPPRERGPKPENDRQPASIGVQGAAVTVSNLKLWRDTYYTMARGPQGHMQDKHGAPLGPDFWSDPTKWGDTLRNQAPQTLYVQPHHYLAMGDNSPESSDGRFWGAVPERLLLGRALLVYYPFPPFGNRVGPIK